jgi:hypothetical protein
MARGDGFSIDTFKMELVSAKLAGSGFIVRNTGDRDTLSAVSTDGTEYVVVVRGRRRTAGPTESQEDEAFKMNPKAPPYPLDDASGNIALAIVAIKVVSERVVVIVAPARKLLEINGYYTSERRDVCYIRMTDDYILRYRSLRGPLLLVSDEPLAEHRELYRRCGGLD